MTGTPQEPNAAPEAMTATGTDGGPRGGPVRGQRIGEQVRGETCLEGANCGERPEDCSASESGDDRGQAERPNVLSFQDLATTGPQAAGRGKTKKSGWGGIRTPGGLSPTAVFKTAALDHSATHPVRDSVLLCWCRLLGVPGPASIRPCPCRNCPCSRCRAAKHRSRNDCRLVKVAIPLRGMISKKHWTVISRTMLTGTSAGNGGNAGNDHRG